MSFESRSYWSGVSAAKLWWHLSNMDMIFNRKPVFLLLSINWENNGIVEIGLITPIPGPPRWQEGLLLALFYLWNTEHKLDYKKDVIYLAHDNDLKYIFRLFNVILWIDTIINVEAWVDWIITDSSAK